MKKITRVVANVNRRASLVLLAILLAAITAIAPVAPVYAADVDISRGEAAEDFCIPSKARYGNNEDNWAAGSWLNIKIINRSKFRVSISSSNGCSNDILVGNTKLSEIPGLAGTYTDNNMDDNFNYKFQRGNAGDDDSTIYRFEKTSDLLKDRFGKYRKIVSRSNFEKVLSLDNTSKGVEIVLSFEEDRVPGYACGAGTNANFALYNQGDDRKAHQWFCTTSASSKKGLIASTRFDSGTYSNFNITYVYKNEKIIRVDEKTGDGDIFEWCENESRYESGTNCNGSWYLDGLSKNALATSSGTREVVLKEKSSNDGMSVVIAGGTSESASITDNPGGDGSIEDEIGADSASASQDCDGGGLGFIICPMVEGLAALADGIVENLLQPILRAELLALPGSGDGNDEALFNAWKAFRNIANALLVLVFLAIIISTAFSSE